MDNVRGIDFARLGLCDALDLAVLIEEEARDRYIELAEQMEVHHTPAAAGFFRFMADNEEKHRVALASRRAEQFGGMPSRVGRAMLFDIEAPEYDEVRASMSVRQALEAAMRSEVKAEHFFASVLTTVTDAQVKALFEELREEEQGHQRLLHRELDRITKEPHFPESFWEDEPVGQ